MVEPKQIQLEELGGDCIGPGDNNTVISLTGSGGEVDAGGNRITNVAAPTSGTDAVNRDYVDGYSGVGSLAQVLLVGNSTGTEDIELSSGTNIYSEDDLITLNDDVQINGALEITGKLTVPGFIDPIGITFTPDTGITAANTIWVDDTTETAFVFNSSSSAEVFRAGEDSEEFIGVGSSFADSGSIRLGNDKYLKGLDTGTNAASLIGLDSSDDIIIGESSGSGEDINVKIYAEDTIEFIDTNTGANLTRFSFLVGPSASTLQFAETNSNAYIEFKEKAGSAGTLNIYGQNSTSSNAGHLYLRSGSSSGGTGTGGSVTITSGTGIGGGDSGGVALLAAGANGVGANAGNIIIEASDALDGHGGDVTITAGRGKTGSWWEDGYYGEVKLQAYRSSDTEDVFKVTTEAIAVRKLDEVNSSGSGVTSMAGQHVYHSRGMTRIVYGAANEFSFNPDWFMVADITYNNGYQF